MSEQFKLLSLGDCRNPNGTWNGAKTLAKVTGRTEAEVRSIWDRIRTLNEEGNMDIKDAAAITVQEHGNKKNP